MNRPTIRGLMLAVAALSFAIALLVYYRRATAGRRQMILASKCQDNLKQIGLNIHAYLAEHQRYPPGTLPNAALAPGRRPGWGVLVYQRDEEGCSGCPKIDPSMAWSDPRVAADSPFSSGEMGCPARPRPALAKLVVPATYPGIAGLGVDAPGLPTGHPRAGIFGEDRSVTVADVADGLANTMMVVESSATSGPWFAGGASTVRGLDPKRKPYLGPGQQFGGNHPGGALALMADGSVRTLSETIQPRLFEALSTIAGGETASAPSAR